MSEESQYCFLVVEDDPLVAMSIEDALRAAGYEVFVNRSLETAALEIECGAIDAALLNAELIDGPSSPLGSALTRQRIPFAVMSDAGRASFLHAYPSICVLGKPVEAAQIEQTARDLLQLRK